AVVAAGQVFVGPDNGLFTPFLDGSDWAAFELVAAEYRLPAVSRTFHGRDVFAPAAAHVAAGVDPSRLGPRVSNPVRLAWPASRRTAEGVAGVVEGGDVGAGAEAPVVAFAGAASFFSLVLPSAFSLFLPSPPAVDFSDSAAFFRASDG